MASGPTLLALLNWRRQLPTFNLVPDQSGFESSASNWSVAAGINAAGTSITRITSDPFAGIGSGELVTTATNGSGTNYLMTHMTFTSGRTYRFRVRLKRVSGTTAGKITIGSLGTGADRASTTFTLTTAYDSYQVDWTPSGNRADAQINITNNAASVLTVRIDNVEVYEVINDISALVTHVRTARGSNFEGRDTLSGSLVLTVKNTDQRFDPDNGSSPYAGILNYGREVWLRGIWAGVEYGLWFGSLLDIVPLPQERLAELHFDDVVGRSGGYEANIPLSTTTAIYNFRSNLLAQAGITGSERVLSTDGPESNGPFTGVSGGNVLETMSRLNLATGSAHYVTPTADPEYPFQFRTKARTEMAAGAPVETFNASETGVTLDAYNASVESVINRQRVKPVLYKKEPYSVLWEADNVPFTVDAGQTRVLWASLSAPVQNGSYLMTAAGSPGVVATFFYESVKFTFTAGGSPAVIHALSVVGNALAAQQGTSTEQFDQTSIDTVGERRGADIEEEFFTSAPDAQALADWIIYRYKNGAPRPNLNVQNRFPSQLQREVLDRIALTASRLSISAKEFLLMNVQHDIVPGLSWTSIYGLEQAPPTDTWFKLDTAGRGLDDAGGGTEGKLAY